jgi:hypothetical protein
LDHVYPAVLLLHCLDASAAGTKHLNRRPDFIIIGPIFINIDSLDVEHDKIAVIANLSDWNPRRRHTAQYQQQLS